jgi:hypothetical protein
MQNEWTLPHGVEGGIRKIDDRFIVDVTPDDGSGVRLSLSLSHTLSPLLASCSSTYGLIVTGVCWPITIHPQETDPRISSHSPPRPLENYKDGIPYPTLTARVFLIRKPQAFLYNVAFPMTVLTTLCGACWGTPPSELGDRLSITLTLMLTAVAQKFAGSSGLPKIS